jgi:carotene biosynthesis associated membrane protein
VTAEVRRPAAWARRVSVPLAAATVLAQIAYPLVRGRARDALTVLAVLLFFAASASHAAASRSRRTAAALVALACGGGLAVEAVGIRTGLPFGEYYYTGGLGPSLAGVPLVIPLAWAMMAWPAHVVAARLTASRPARVAVAAAALASWDLFLDPQMVDAGHWRWMYPTPALPGVPDVPLSNYLGWAVVALALMAALDRFAADAPRRAGTSDAVPVGMYLWTYASSVLAHAAFFGLTASALWGGVGMGLVALPLARSLRRAEAAT